MYVCLCHGVTDRQIRCAADDGAHTISALERTLGVGAGCGSCVPMAREILDAHRDAHRGCESQSKPLALASQPAL